MDTYTVAASNNSTLNANEFPLKFTGKTSEYFKIWIVNLALIILTLGIYSAWATVRKKRYFYSNTLLDGEIFEYRGNPINILKGRLVALGLFGSYYVSVNFYPLFSLPLIIVIALMTPWLICQSFAFNAHNTAHRNIRFGFSGRYAEALKVIIGIGALIPLTLGFIFPYYKKRQVSFIANHHRFGNCQFNAAYSTGKFYRIYFVVAALVMGMLILLGVAIASTQGFQMVAPAVQSEATESQKLLLMIFPLLPTYIFYLFVFVYVRVRVTNVVWNNLKIGPVSFLSMLTVRGLLMLYVTNILAIIFTAGLATPWASIRNARYRASKTVVKSSQPLDGFAAQAHREVGATGEAATEIFGLDLSV